MIQFYSDVLAPNALHIAQGILRGPHWGFGFISNDPHKPIWNFNKEAARGVADALMATSILREYELLDFHVNGQTFTQDTAIHHDAGMGATHAFVFFPNWWEYTDGGQLHIMTNTPTIVTPQANFGVLFDASIPHYAQGPAVRHLLRVSVGLKLVKA